ncbi:MAG: DUF2806 domain-containing protein [Thermodesulfobacteriota bacterium]
MNEETPNSLVNLGDLSKPADTLIRKLFAVVGLLYKPYHVKRMAKAETAAALIRAQGEIEVTDLQRRAAHRWFEEESKKQVNMEQITRDALPLVTDNANPEAIEDDWITYFFDKCRIVSDTEMQSLWSRILAGEANAPGSYSRRTVNLVSELDKSEALLFTQLCGYAWAFPGEVVPIVLDFHDAIYAKNGIDFGLISELESIGLIQFSSIGKFQLLDLPKRVTVLYHGQPVELEMSEDNDNVMHVGQVLLTKMGRELAPICGSRPVDGFKEYVLDRWKALDYLKKEIPEQGAEEQV